MDDEFEIPLAFWQTLSDDEWQSVLHNNGLTVMLCLRLWKILKRTDKVPTFVRILVNRADVERLWPKTI